MKGVEMRGSERKMEGEKGEWREKPE